MIIYAAMAMLAIIVLPTFVLEPSSFVDPGALIGLAVFLVLELGLFMMTKREVELTLDPKLATLKLTSRRWPFSPSIDVLLLSEIVEVSIERSPRKPTYRVTLELTEARTHPLTSSYYGNLTRMQRDAAAIRGLCGLPEQG